MTPKKRKRDKRGPRGRIIRRGTDGFFMLSSIMLAALTFIGAILVTTTSAGFSDATDSTSNSWSTDGLNAPTGVSASSGGAIVIGWTPTSDTYASGHRVLRSTSPGGPYVQIAEITPRTTASYTDSPPAGTYYYVVRSFHLSWESPNSTEASGTAVAVGIAGGWQTGLTHVSGAGNNRALVFFASNEQQAGTTPTLSGVTYGGQPLVPVSSDQVTSTSKTALIEIWLLDEAGIAAASGTALVPTWTSAPDVALYSHVMVDNVDQLSPTGATAAANSPADAPNPAPIGSVATSNLDMVVVGATAGEVGTYAPQNGFVVGVNHESTTGGTTAQGTAHKPAVGSPETPTMLFVPGAPPFINRQVVSAVVMNVAP